MAALHHFNPKVDRRRDALTHRAREAVKGWIERIEGLPAAGLMLRRDRLGWSHIEVVQ